MFSIVSQRRPEPRVGHRATASRRLPDIMPAPRAAILPHVNATGSNSEQELRRLLGGEPIFLGDVYLAASDDNGEGLANPISSRGNGRPEDCVTDRAGGSILSALFKFLSRRVGVLAGRKEWLDGHAARAEV